MVPCYSPMDQNRLVLKRGKIAEEIPNKVEASLEPDNGKRMEDF